jgi:hypothetical protein
MTNAAVTIVHANRSCLRRLLVFLAIARIILAHQRLSFPIERLAKHSERQQLKPPKAGARDKGKKFRSTSESHFALRAAVFGEKRA